MKRKSVILQSIIMIACLILLGLAQPLCVAGSDGQYYDGDPTIENDGIEFYDMIGNDSTSHVANQDLKTTVPATVDIQVIGGGSIRHGNRAYHSNAHLQTTYMRFQIVPDDGHVLEKVMWNGYDVTKHINRGFLQFQDLEDGVLVAIFKEMKVKELPCPMADDCHCKDRGRCCREPERCCGGMGRCQDIKRCGGPCGKGPCGEKGPCKGECCKGPTTQTSDKRDELVLSSLIVLVACTGIFTLTYIKKKGKSIFGGAKKYVFAKR